MRRRQSMNPFRQVLATLILVTLTAAPSLAQDTFVYTNNDVYAQNVVSGFRVERNGTLVPVPGSPFATGGSGSAGGFYASNRTTLSAGGDLLFVSNSGSNDISVFRVDRRTGVLVAVRGSPFAIGA